jgi:hypothetical protein
VSDSDSDDGLSDLTPVKSSEPSMGGRERTSAAVSETPEKEQPTRRRRPDTGGGSRAVGQHAAKKLEIGWLGVVFGDAAEKPGNIAAVAMLLAFLMIAILYFAPDSPNIPKREMVTLWGSIITGALGFLFGRSSR